jgi:hypothetical protein
MIYKSSLNHKGNRATFKDFFGCSVIVFQVCDGFSFAPFDPPYFGWSHLTNFFIFSTIQVFVGAQIVGLRFLFGMKFKGTLSRNSQTSKTLSVR